jgi:hypothetical protein|tara:strand:+ start:555 stop:755 length:201 start_codon:yes stop_codon:yes gene_type:complete
MTANKENLQPTTGQTWHVRINNAQCLTTFKILELSRFTVVVKSLEVCDYSSRYHLDDLEFIERVID